MGAWGYYDDENDNVADAMLEIEEKLIAFDLVTCSQMTRQVSVPYWTVKRGTREYKKSKQWPSAVQKHIEANVKPGEKLYAVSLDESEKPYKAYISIKTKAEAQCWKKREAWLQKDNAKVLVKAIEKYMQRYEELNPGRPEAHDEMLAGLAVAVARQWKNTPIFPQDFGDRTNRGFRFPQTLSPDFPSSFKRKAKAASQRSLNRLKNKNAMEWMDVEARKQALTHQIALFS